ncbi:MAG: hypothetical protein ACRC1T_09895 [Clostridium chrysemydis]|uniref:hypothetical protein n=1 Tax=Clostridium chrysemydis TaxID=2665504 RepID=UPI003F316C17
MKKLLIMFMLVSSICLADKIWVYDARVLANVKIKVNEFIEGKEVKEIVIRPYVRGSVDVSYLAYVIYK